MCLHFYFYSSDTGWINIRRVTVPDNVKRGRGRPNLTWEKSVKKDLKDWNITKGLVMNMGVWKLAIHVSEPWLGFGILGVSTLAYPDLFGTERFQALLLWSLMCSTSSCMCYRLNTCSSTKWFAAAQSMFWIWWIGCLACISKVAFILSPLWIVGFQSVCFFFYGSHLAKPWDLQLENMEIFWCLNKWNSEHGL